jgi:hypothetical protein
VNKNVLLKGKLGSDAVSVLAAVKTWFNPSMALAAAAEYGFKRKNFKYGLTIQVGRGWEARGTRGRGQGSHGGV